MIPRFHPIHLLFTVGLSFFLLAGCSSGLFRSPEHEIPTLEQQLSATADSLLVINEEELGATVALDIRAMDGSALYAYDPNRLMVPSSVMKLITAAYVLHSLPEDYRWETEIYSTGPMDSAGVLHGDLVIKGGWDPSLSGSRPYAEWPWEHLKAWAELFYLKGLRQIDGKIIPAGLIVPPFNWESEDLMYRYAPVVSQLSWNDGLVKVEGHWGPNTIARCCPSHAFWSMNYASYRLSDFNILFGLNQGTFTYEEDQPADWDLSLWQGETFNAQDPRMLTADALRQAFFLTGITGGDSVAPTLFAPERPEGETIGIIHQSLPLDSLVSAMLKTSNNLWAEQLLYTTSRVVEDHVEFADAATIYNELQVDGVTSNSMDGSGLARRDNLSPQQVTDLLLYSHNRWGERWLDLLPEPGETGSTLENRLLNGFGRIRAKTGSMSRNRSLAGYFLDDDGNPIGTFCVIVNNSPTADSNNSFGNLSADLDRYIVSVLQLLDQYGVEAN